MSAERLELSKVQPEPPVDADYDAICTAVTATARGRWFLDEFAKRNRHSNTTEVLAAIAQMQAAVVGERTQQASREAHQEVRIELLEMARTIAQARAEVAESRPAPSQQGAAAPAGGAVAPDVAAAAERLRQIAWTIRACGIELPDSEQIGEIANAILSADALRGLGEQRAQKLTEALHYLEHRIEQMLDGHRAAPNEATDAEPVTDGPSPVATDHAREPTPVTLAVAMIAAAMRPDPAAAAEAEPEIAPAAEARAAAMAQDALAASGVTDYPMDDDNDVVLTVADSAPAPDRAPEPVPPAAVVAQAPQDERVALEFEPLMPVAPPAAADPGFAGLEFEPLAIGPMVLAAPTIEPHAAVADGPADRPAGDDPALPQVELAATAVEPNAEPDEPDSGANDNLPLMLATTVTAKAAPEADTIAMQVDQDLEGLTDSAPDGTIPDITLPIVTMDTAVAPRAQPLAAQAAPDDDPAESLLEASPQQARVSAAVAGAQAARAQLSDTLAAIESELFGSTRPDGRPGAPAPTVIPPVAEPIAAPVATGPLAALMAMSEEERIALFS